jgi:hypothetical protein
MANCIHNVATQIAERNGCAFPMVVIGLDVYDLVNVESFMQTVVDTFKNQRMCSPPQTAGLFVTLIGDLTAEMFRDQWIRASQRDPIVKGVYGTYDRGDCASRKERRDSDLPHFLVMIFST